MLRRLYIDNFMAFVNYEQKFGRKQLILGGNGAGKSSLLNGLFKVRQFLARGDRAEDTFLPHERTRWLNQSKQTWEIEAELDRAVYVYRLVVDFGDSKGQPRVTEETLHCDSRLAFEFVRGSVRLFSDEFEHEVTYPFDDSRSALATIRPESGKLILTRFLDWFARMLFFRLNPFVIDPQADGEDVAPNVNLSNFASWYRYLLQAYPAQNFEYIRSLASVIDGLTYLKFQNPVASTRILVADFKGKSGSSVTYGFHQLSDGQRCLICLYAILHFVLGQGYTTFIDEPDNFVSLREIQPWLMFVNDRIDEEIGQMLIVTHHPELINQWAPSAGISFFREDGGSVRSKPFTADAESPLTPSELIARGWERE